MLHKDEIPLGNAKDLRDQKFGRLTPLYRIHTDKHYILWRCKCDCGEIKDVTSSNLVNGKTKSCGCLRKEQLIKRNKEHKNYSNIANQRFGKLVALKRLDEKTSNNQTIWLCKCDCGNYCKKGVSNLKRGNALSCGCLKSKGEERIYQILQTTNLTVEREKTFESCRFSDSHQLAFFDFYVDNRYLIEYDGIQHFESKKTGWNNEKRLEYTKKHDEEKNNWCIKNNITLIRIPYICLQEITLKDLIPETSPYCFYKEEK